MRLVKLKILMRNSWLGNCYFWFSKHQNTAVKGAGHASRNNTESDINNHNRLSWPQFYQRTRSTTNSGTNYGKNADDRRRRDSLSNNNPNSVALERVLCPSEARAMQRANQIVMYVITILGRWCLVFFLSNFICWWR